MARRPQFPVLLTPGNRRFLRFYGRRFGRRRRRNDPHCPGHFVSALKRARRRDAPCNFGRHDTAARRDKSSAGSGRSGGSLLKSNDDAARNRFSGRPRFETLARVPVRVSIAMYIRVTPTNDWDQKICRCFEKVTWACMHNTPLGGGKK